MIRLLCAFLVALLCPLFLAPVAADELRPSVIELREGEGGAYTLDWKLTVPASRARQASQEGVLLAEPVIPASCVIKGEPVQRAAALTLFGRANLDCEGTLQGESFGLTELIGRSDAIARMIPSDRPVQTFRLTADAPLATIRAEPGTFDVLRDYFIIGAEHILFGWDHLLFVIALVFLIRQPWPVIKAATAFTVAHSITLVATTLGYAGLPSRPVEALIALSIVFLAVEVALVLRDPGRMTLTRRSPWAVAFAFGLFHGFGFAGALADIGLPSGEIAAALLAFNLGVEAGQLLIVAALVILLALASRIMPKLEAPALKLATYAIGTIGSFWLIERVMG
ncbi:MAG: HupE/UreJ family protein [Pseudomonadota bacterium]